MATYRGVAATAIRQLESRVLHAEEAVKAGLADQVADFSEAFRAFQHFVKSGGTKSPVKPAVAAADVSSPKLTGLEALTAQLREQIRPGLEAKLTAELASSLLFVRKQGSPCNWL